VPAVAIDKTTSGANTVIYAGGANGGIWKSSNNGTTWTPTSDQADSMAIGAIAIDPANNQIIYAGTGEANQSADSYYGSGVLKSTNGGSTWTLNGGAFFGTRNSTINRIFVDPNNSTIVYAASSLGFIRSTDSGVTWARMQGGLPNSGNVVIWDAVIDSRTNPSTLYVMARNNGIYKSTNGGTSWVAQTTGLPAGTVFANRGRMAIAPSNRDVLYIVLGNGSGLTFSGSFNGAYYTTDGGTNWASMAAHNTDVGGGQAWYDLNIIVDPLDDNKVFIAGIDLWVATNARGTSVTGNFHNVTNSYGGTANTHPDTHGLDFGACTVAPCRLYIGNDGGVFYSDDPGTVSGVATWVNLNDGLAISEFTGGDIGPNYATTAQAFGGTQDNGSLRLDNTSNGNWSMRRGGDGGFAVINWQTPTTIFTQTQNGNIYRSTNGGNTFSFLTNPSSSLFYAPITMDRTTSTHLAWGGVNFVYETTNNGTNWYASNNASLAGNVSSLAIAPSNSAVIYAGTTNGKVCKTTSGNTGTSSTYTCVTVASGQWMTSLWVDLTDPNTVYVTGGIFYAGNAGYLYKSTNGGTSWTSIRGTLPNIPIQSVVGYQSQTGRVLVVGNDAGVYYTADEGTTWVALNSGLPKTAVTQLAIDPANTTIIAFTHGRSAWKLDLPQYVPATNTPTVTNTATHTNTPLPTFTPTASHTSAATATHTNTATATHTHTATATFTNTPPPTFTPDPTATHTATATHTRTNTATSTLTPSATNTPVPAMDTIGVFKDGSWSLRNSNSAGSPDITAIFGITGDLPVVGDWNNDSIDTIGLYRNGLFFLSDSNTTPAVNYNFAFGNPGDRPIAGKWDAMTNGSGIGVYRPSNGVVYLRRSVTVGFDDYYLIYGDPGDQPIAGDWDGNGFDGVGLYRTSNQIWYLRNNPANGVVYSDIDFTLDIASHSPIAGDWNGDVVSTVGYFTNAGVFSLHSTNATAGTDNIFAFGPTNGLPVAGKWALLNRPNVVGVGVIQPQPITVPGNSENAD
jgi:photosystem II stability/assembly factor-like uncharacterized protein